MIKANKIQAFFIYVYILSSILFVNPLLAQEQKLLALNDFLNVPDSIQNIPSFKNGYDEKSKIIQTGFIAQEVEAAAKALDFEFSGIDLPKNENDHYSLRYAEFVVPLVKAVQELSKENEALKNKLASYESRLAEIESMLPSKSKF